MEFNIKRLTDEEFNNFSRLIHEESGIFLKDSKITLLSNRLRKRLQALNLSEFSDYYRYLQKLSGEDKKRGMSSFWMWSPPMRHTSSGNERTSRLSPPNAFPSWPG
jgi:hypothetical protein